MYNLRINTITGAQQITQYTLEGCSLVRFYESDSIRLRTKLDGNIIFYGGAYAELQKLRDAGRLRTKIYLEYNGVDIYSGQLQLQGIWKANENLCELSVEIEDEYTQLLKGIDRTFSWINTQLESRCNVQTSRRYQMQSGSAEFNNVFDDPETSDCGERYYSTNIREYEPGEFYKKARKLGSSSDGTTYYSGYIDSSYCKVLANTYVALKSGVLVNPTDIDQEDWLPVSASQTAPTGFPKMAQLYARINFKDAILSEYSKDWVLGTCVVANQQWYFESRSLRSMLESSLQAVDPAITVGGWDLGNIYIYNNKLGERFELKLEDIIGIYKILFKVDWRLESGEFWFRTFTESQPNQPISYTDNEFQYIDRVFSKDWSNQRTAFDISKKVNEISVEIDQEPFYADFMRSVITYDTFYSEKYDVTGSNFLLDIAQLTRTTDDKIAVIIQDGAGFMINGYGLEDEWVYNLGLSLFEIVKNNYKFGTSFDKGILSIDGWDFKEDIDLVTDYNERTDIKIPYANPFVIDFSLYLKTSFGDMKCIEMKTNLSSAITVITGGKQ